VNGAMRLSRPTVRALAVGAVGNSWTLGLDEAKRQDCVGLGEFAGEPTPCCRFASLVVARPKRHPCANADSESGL